MPIRYKTEILPALKAAGYNTNRMRKEKILGESVIQQLRTGALVSWTNMARICDLLDCQPGDILEYVKEDTPGTEKIKAAIDQLLANEEAAEE